MATTVIFDLMDTAVWDPFRIVPQHLGLSLEELLRLKDPTRWLDFELGLIDEATFFDRFFLPECGRRLIDGASLKRAMFAQYRFLDGMEALLGELRAAGVQMWIRSNYTIWAEDVRAMLDLDRYFSGYAMSYIIQARKPDLEAYR